MHRRSASAWHPTVVGDREGIMERCESSGSYISPQCHTTNACPWPLQFIGFRGPTTRPKAVDALACRKLEVPSKTKISPLKP